MNSPKIQKQSHSKDTVTTVCRAESKCSLAQSPRVCRTLQPHLYPGSPTSQSIDSSFLHATNPDPKGALPPFPRGEDIPWAHTKTTQAPTNICKSCVCLLLSLSAPGHPRRWYRQSPGGWSLSSQIKTKRLT